MPFDQAPHQGAQSNLDGPVMGYYTITPSDTVDLPLEIRGIHVVSAGNVAGVGFDGVTSPAINVAEGTYYPYRFKRILATGTTAGLIGLI